MTEGTTLLHVTGMLNIHKLSHLFPSQKTYKLNAVISPILLVKKLKRLREVIH